MVALSNLKNSLEHTRRLIKDMMSADLLQLAIGYEGDIAPAYPTEALASELDGKLAPLAMGLLRLGVLHHAV